MLRRFRSAITGRFVRPQDAADHPDITVSETVSESASVEAELRWELGTQRAAMVGAAGDLERLSTEDRALAETLDRTARALRVAAGEES